MKPQLSVYEYEKLLQNSIHNPNSSNANVDFLEYVPTYENLQYCKYDSLLSVDLVTREVHKDSDFLEIKTINSIYILNNRMRIRCTMRSKLELEELKANLKNSNNYSFNMKYFDYKHLPEHLQEISKPIHDLAHAMVKTLKNENELNAGLRKLLEAKDCFVRAGL